MLVSTKFLTFREAEDDGWSLFPSVVQGIATAALTATLTLSALAGQTASLGGNEDFASAPGANVSLQAGYPRQINVRYAWTPDEVPQASLLDEDYWLKWISLPLSTVIQVPQSPISSGVAAIAAIAEEDFWSNPVSPVPLVFQWPQPWSFDVQEPGGLFGQYDEDFWQNAVAPIPA